ncbi:MAG: tetratricopeptide repeat protein [Magnetospiraceae bacterium]
MTGEALTGMRDIVAAMQVATDDAARLPLYRALAAHLKTNPEDHLAHFTLAVNAFWLEDYVAAIQHGKAALEHHPACREYAEALSGFHAAIGDVGNTAFYRKLAGALTSDAAAAEVPVGKLANFESLLTEGRDDPIHFKAIQAVLAGQFARAEFLYHQHLHFNPKSVDGYIGLTTILLNGGRAREALDILRAARHNDPLDPRIASLMGTAQTQIGDFEPARASHLFAIDQDPEDPETTAKYLLSRHAFPWETAAGLGQAMAAFGPAFGIPDLGTGGGRPHRVQGRASIAYLIPISLGVGERAALAQIFQRHDGNRFRLLGLGYGAMTAPANTGFQAAMEGWYDVASLDLFTLAQIVEREHIDVLVDLGGLTTAQFLPLFESRIAPVQLSWQGLSTWPGLAHLDGIFCDPLQAAGAPPEARLRPLEGGTALLPRPTPVDAAPPASAEGEGPDAAPLVFGADATLAELTSDTLAAWARVLIAVPEAMLILRDHDFHNPDNLARITDLFANFGIMQRVDILQEADPVRFFQFTDIALLPWPARRLSTAVNALAAGLPVFCPVGDAPHRREVAGFLAQCGLQEDCLVETADTLVEKAARFAADPGLRQAFRTRAIAALGASPAFDFAARARALEACYDEMLAAAEQAP